MNGKKSGTGRSARDRTASNETGLRLGETGYLERPERSYALDRQWEEPPPPTVRQEVSTIVAVAQPFSKLSPLPEQKRLVIGYRKNGTQIITDALASKDDLPALRSLIDQIHEELTPAEPEEISALLGRLFSHYPQQVSGNTMTVAQDWIEDLSHVSAKALRAAVVDWRRSDNRFRPSPGQLLKIIAGYEAPMRKTLAQALELERV